MAAQASVLKLLIEQFVNLEMATIVPPGSAYAGPLAQPNPSYFKAMCGAIAEGFASQPVLGAETEDDGLAGLPPVVGTGTGIGLQIDAARFEETIYTKMRDFALADFGTTGNPPYSDFFLPDPPAPPPNRAPDNHLRALAKGIALATEQHYKLAWNISSTHLLVYTGVAEIPAGNITGVVASAIQAAMIAAAPTLAGSYWPRTAEAIAAAYEDVISNATTNLIPIVISGICIPTTTQTCGIPIPGGVGVAVIS